MTPAALEIKLKKILASCETQEQVGIYMSWLFRIENRPGKDWKKWMDIINHKRILMLNDENHKSWKELELV